MNYQLKNNGVDWNNYNNEFPSRYIKESKLDFYLHRIVSDILAKPKYDRILDVGGGPNFTSALRRIIDQSAFVGDLGKIDLLDPYVKMNDIGDKYKIETEQVDWDRIKSLIKPRRFKDQDPKYNLIVCRGSLNYLTLEQIAIISCALDNNGTLIANSFADPTEIVRDVSLLDGTSAKESCVASTINGQVIMKHMLEVGNNKVITHESYYHKPFSVVEAIGSDNIQVEFYGKNSVLYVYNKKW